jgi:hypothetical protein
MTKPHVPRQLTLKTFHRIGSGMIMVGILLMALGAYLYWEKRSFLERSATTVGRVVRNKGGPFIEFHTLSGDTVLAKLTGSHPKTMRHDEVVEIVYSVDAPRKVVLKARQWYGLWFCAVFGCAHLFIGWVMRKGTTVVGPVTNNDLNSHTKP